MTKKTWIGAAGRRWLLIVLAAASLGGLAGCGGEERLSREEFSDRLQSIDRRASEQYGRLAEQATRLKPDRPIPNKVKQGMREYAAGLQRAADELDELNPPEGAEEATKTLIEALRERADGFGQAAREERITLRQLGEFRQESITKSGDKIDRAFEQLRTEGFDPKAPEE